MVGLLVIAAYAIFWIICLILAVWISKISKKYRLIVGVIVFFTISFAPYYYYLYDKAMYDQACQNAEMFFPETPYEKPEILYIYEHDPQRNPPGYYTGGHIFDYMTTLPDIGNSYVVNSDGIVETIKSSVVGDFRSRFDVTPEQLERNWKVLEVYPSNEKNKLEGEKRQEVLIKLRYGI
ncbi:MAG: hypothetical protein OEY96_12640, partial [Gammaproteobacteria bacterium]|nr:hypothetical protein [Gammaproteobacteria bacterium]